MAKKFTWYKALEHTDGQFSEKEFAKATKLRYSDADLFIFYTYVSDLLGVDADTDKETEAFKQAFDELRALVESGEYDKTLHQEMVEYNG